MNEVIKENTLARQTAILLDVQARAKKRDKLPPAQNDVINRKFTYRRPPLGYKYPVGDFTDEQRALLIKDWITSWRTYDTWRNKNTKRFLAKKAAKQARKINR